MKWVFTKHAQERLELRKISVRKVLTVIKNYDIKAIEEENKIAYYKKETKELSLKVVTIKDKDSLRIITVHRIETKRLKNIKNLIEII